MEMTFCDFSLDLTLEIDFLGVIAGGLITGGLIGCFGVLFAIIFTGEVAFFLTISSLLLLVDSMLEVFCLKLGLWRSLLPILGS